VKGLAIQKSREAAIEKAKVFHMEQYNKADQYQLLGKLAIAVEVIAATLARETL
jgi:hypothetical protein